jgi:hypothetical protein
MALNNMIKLLDICSNTEILDIVCDTEFATLLPWSNNYHGNYSNVLSTI